MYPSSTRNLARGIEQVNGKTYSSDLVREVPFSTVTENGRVSRPRASGDQGIEPTPKSCGVSFVSAIGTREQELRADLQCREHLTLLLAIDEVVMVLHRDERRELVVDCVVCVQACISPSWSSS